MAEEDEPLTTAGEALTKGRPVITTYRVPCPINPGGTCRYCEDDPIFHVIESHDPQVWAEAFQAVYRHLAHQGYADPMMKPVDDTGWLIGWFANAMMAYQHYRPVPLATGYEIADAMDRGDMVFVQFLTGADGAWFLADEHNDDYPDGTPSSWWREHVGQIAVAAYATERIGDPIPDVEPVGVTTDLPGRVNVTIRNVPNDGP